MMLILIKIITNTLIILGIVQDFKLTIFFNNFLISMRINLSRFC